MSGQAVTAGVSAMPTPDTDSGSDLWYVYEMIIGRFLVNSAVGFESSDGQVVRLARYPPDLLM